MLSRRGFLSLSAIQLAAMSRLPGYAVASGPGEAADVLWFEPSDAQFAKYATPFNQRIKTRPRLIAACRTEAGVAEAMAYANKMDLPVAVKAGGHSFEGFSLNSDGLVIDVSQLKDQQADEKHYYAGSGVRLSEAYDFLLPRGRIVPMGSCGSVGLAGLTLGGGYGLFARSLGLTCDNLVAVRMVDGQGRVRDSRHDAELLWACRGGNNGNFGVVTGLWYTTDEAPATLPRERIRFRNLDAEAAASLCERWFAQAAMLPDDAFSAFVLNGTTLTILITWFKPESRDKVAAVTQAMAKGADSIAKPANEPIGRAVRRYYGAHSPLHFKNVSAGYYRGYDELSPGIHDIFQSITQGHGLIFQINTLGGRIDRINPDTAAYPHRGYPYLGELQCYWDNDAQTESRVAQVNQIQQHIAAMGIKRHYRNYPSAELSNPSAAYYGPQTLARLQRCKQQYDPANRIRHAQSIKV